MPTANAPTSTHGTGPFFQSSRFGPLLSFKTRFLMHLSYVLAYTIGAALFALATAAVWPFVEWWWPLADLSHPMLEGLARGGFAFATYLLWGLALLAVIAVVRNVTRLSVPTGRFKMRSWSMARFYLYNVLMMMARYFFLFMTRSTRINVAFYRLMGAKIGSRTVINTVHVYDCNLLEMGDDVTIGGSAVVMAHMGQDDDVYIAPVVLEDRASLGQGAIVFPGAHIGEGAVVGAGSVVPRDFEVPAGTKWSGVPIERVDDDADLAT